MTPDLSEELRRNCLFTEFTDEQLDKVLETLKVREFEKGEQVFARGDPALVFFLVRNGQIKTYRLSPGGQEKVLDIITPGQTFAESVIFAGPDATYPMHAQAIERSSLLAIGSHGFRSLLQESVQTCFRMMGAMSRRLHQQVNEIDGLTLHDATYRLVAYLLEQVPAGVVESPRVFLSTSKNVIASRLSIQPETFSRILSRLAKQGLLDVHGNYIELHDIPAMRRLLRIDHPTC